MHQEVKVTKSLIKAVDDLEKCVGRCDKDARLQKSLRRITDSLRKHLKVEQKGGSDGLQDARIYNVQGMIDSGRDIPGSMATSHLEHVPTPFSAGSDMKSLELLASDEQPKFIPDNYQSVAPASVSGGGMKKNKNNKKQKRTSSK